MGRPPKRKVPASTPHRRVQRYVCGVYALLLAYVSLAPGQRIPSILDWSTLFTADKVAHFGAYAIFTVLLSFSIGTSPAGRRTAFAIVSAFFFGVLMEVLQGLMGAGREFDPVDMVANLIGALLGGAAYWLLLKIKIPGFALAESLR